MASSAKLENIGEKFEVILLVFIFWSLLKTRILREVREQLRESDRTD